MMCPLPSVSYQDTPHGVLADLIAESTTEQPLVVGAARLSVAQVYRIAHAGQGSALRPRKVVLTEDETVRAALDASVANLHKWLEENRVIYGVNTGYGGTGVFNKHLGGQGLQQLQEVLINGLLASAKQDMLPIPFVRAGMLVRAVSNLVGVSALRTEVIEALLTLLNEDVVPVIPLKGSLTASGDLVSLAYMTAVLQGVDDPAIEVIYQGQRIKATEARAKIGLAPIVLGPKEGLALVNGTSMAAGAACDVAVQGLNGYFLTIVLTAMANCAVRGTLQSYHPLLAEVKPHAGQEYSSRLIFNLLHSVSDELLDKHDLTGFSRAQEHRVWQLTYPFRCASQHLAPEYDILLGTLHDLTVEINSASDNPLSLADDRREMVVSGGNFLGSTVARDMDKMKLSLHSLARLVHAQFKFLVRGVEHIVSKTERETITERFIATHIIPLESHPTASMGFQGVEIYMDALLSEMNQKVGPHSTTYLSAEKDNQAIVAMGLAAARTAADLAVDLHYCLAAHLLAVCQAFDLTTLDTAVIRRHEGRRENVHVENPRSAELGLLEPVYQYVRQECGVPVLFASQRMHTYLEPLVKKIASLELISAIYENTIQRAVDDSAYDQHRTSFSRRNNQHPDRAVSDE